MLARVASIVAASQHAVNDEGGPRGAANANIAKPTTTPPQRVNRRGSQ